MSDETTPEEAPYADYAVTKNGVTAYVAYRIIDTDLLEQDAPDECEWARTYTYDDEGEQTGHTLCTLGELLGYKRDLGDGTTLIKLSACQYCTGRKKAVTADDLAEWEAYFESSDDWLTKAAAQEIITSLETDE